MFVLYRKKHLKLYFVIFQTKHLSISIIFNVDMFN